MIRYHHYYKLSPQTSPQPMKNNRDKIKKEVFINWSSQKDRLAGDINNFTVEALSFDYFFNG